ncbi:MAG: hypothetical protein LW832_05935 [Parachlamydia sp.]|nr:hypothetical protein [Parachlamydia sp.]
MNLLSRIQALIEANKTLSEKISSNENGMAKKSVLEALKQNVIQLDGKNNQLNQSLSAAREEIIKLKVENEVLSQRSLSSFLQLTTVENELRNQKKLYDNSLNADKELNEKHTETFHAYKIALERLDAVEEELSNLNIENGSMKEINVDLETKKNQIEMKLEQAKKNYKASKAAFERKTHELNCQHQIVEEKSHQINQLEIEYRQLKTQNEENKQKALELERKLVEAVRKSDLLILQKDQLQIEYDQLNVKYQRLKEENDDLIQKTNRLESRCSNLSNRLSLSEKQIFEFKKEELGSSINKGALTKAVGAGTLFTIIGIGAAALPALPIVGIAALISGSSYWIAKEKEVDTVLNRTEKIKSRNPDMPIAEAFELARNY